MPIVYILIFSHPFRLGKKKVSLKKIKLFNNSLNLESNLLVAALFNSKHLGDRNNLGLHLKAKVELSKNIKSGNRRKGKLYAASEGEYTRVYQGGSNETNDSEIKNSNISVKAGMTF